MAHDDLLSMGTPELGRVEGLEVKTFHPKPQFACTPADARLAHGPGVMHGIPFEVTSLPTGSFHVQSSWTLFVSPPPHLGSFPKRKAIPHVEK